MLIRQQGLDSEEIGLGLVFSTPSPAAQIVAMDLRKHTMAATPFCYRQTRRILFEPATATRNGKTCLKPSVRRHWPVRTYRTRASLAGSLIDCSMRTLSRTSTHLADWSWPPESQSLCSNDAEARRPSCTQQSPETKRTTCVFRSSHALRASRSRRLPTGNHQIPNPRRNWTQAKEEKQ